MDMWKYYDITHRHHVICNPTNSEKLDRLVELLRLPAGASVVDIASGKGEFLIRLAETYGVSGVGIDKSPFFAQEAEERLAALTPSPDIVFHEMDGAEFVPEAPRSFDVASCIGASWIYGGHGGTLDAMKGLVAPGGWVVVGEAFWTGEPAAEYLELSGMPREMFASHVENATAGEERGLELVHTLVSTGDDWDRYEGLQWYAASEFARANPEDPDLDDLAERIAKEKMMYLRWGRDSLGWAMYVFRQAA